MDCFAREAYLLVIVLGHVTRHFFAHSLYSFQKLSKMGVALGAALGAAGMKTLRFEAIKFLIIFRKVQKTLRSVSVAKRTTAAVQLFLRKDIRRSKSAKLFWKLKRGREVSWVQREEGRGQRMANFYASCLIAAFRLSKINNKSLCYYLCSRREWTSGISKAQRTAAAEVKI